MGGNYPVGLQREPPAAHLPLHNLRGYWIEFHKILPFDSLKSE